MKVGPEVPRVEWKRRNRSQVVSEAKLAVYPWSERGNKMEESRTLLKTCLGNWVNKHAISQTGKAGKKYKFVSSVKLHASASKSTDAHGSSSISVYWPWPWMLVQAHSTTAPWGQTHHMVTSTVSCLLLHGIFFGHLHHSPAPTSFVPWCPRMLWMSKKMSPIECNREKQKTER